MQQIIDSYSTLTWEAYKEIENGNLSVLFGVSEDVFLCSDVLPDLRFLHVSPRLPPPTVMDVTCSEWLDVSIGTPLTDIAADLLGAGCLFVDVLRVAQDLRFTFERVTASYPQIFSSRGDSGPTLLAQFGALKLVLNLVPLTGHPLHALMSFPLYEVLNLIAFSIANAGYEESKMKELLSKK